MTNLSKYETTLRFIDLLKITIFIMTICCLNYKAEFLVKMSHFARRINNSGQVIQGLLSYRGPAKA